MLRLPGGKPVPEVPVSGRRVLRSTQITILPAPLLRAIVKISTALKHTKEKWAFDGDAAEVIKGVNVSADHLEIVTTKAGTAEICDLLSEYVSLPPAEVVKKLPREAYVESATFAVYTKSRYAELTVDKIRVEVHGDLQYRVAEWEWGEPIEYEAEYVNIVGTSVPTVPLRLRSELDMGLGWYDRVQLISDAVTRSQSRH